MQLQGNSNLGPILHRLAIIHPWQTDRWTTDRRQQQWQRVNRWVYSL